MHDTLEALLRKAAQSMRLEAEKRRAQRERLKDAKAYQNLDAALQGMSDRRVEGSKNRWKSEQVVLQRQAKSRGLLKKGADGKHWYEREKVDRDNRPAEKLMTNKTKGSGMSL